MLSIGGQLACEDDGELGSVLLLARKKEAAPVILVSLVTMVITAIRNYGFDFDRTWNYMDGAVDAIWTVGIFVVALSLYLYSHRMAERGILA